MTFIKSRSQELDIPEGNPFENDKLDRSQFSNILTDGFYIFNPAFYSFHSAVLFI